MKCMSESCASKVRAFSQQKLNRLWAIIVYNGPHTCPSVRVNKDGRMMDSNFLAQELHKYILEDHTYKIKNLQNLMKERFQHEILYYKIWDAKQRPLQTHMGIRKSHTKSYRSCCWHIKIVIRVHKCLIGQSMGTHQVLLYLSMCSALSLLPLLDSYIVGQ